MNCVNLPRAVFSGKDGLCVLFSKEQKNWVKNFEMDVLEHLAVFLLLRIPKMQDPPNSKKWTLQLAFSEARLRDKPKGRNEYVLEVSWNSVISVRIRSLCLLFEWQELSNEKTENICILNLNNNLQEAL